MPKTYDRRIERFYLLDVLRGLASFSVLVWHYQHFFFRNCKLPPDFNRSIQPGYGILKPFYEHGDIAVYLFFNLSGFIFFHLYAKGIAKRIVSLKSFTANRFSRLYPLHLATLLLTAVLQYEYRRHFNTYFVYEFNDLKHFALQLAFASYWGLQDGHSFNGPIWSVSVEVLLYILFFRFCRRFPLRPAWIGSLCLLGLAIGGVHVGAGIFCFFLGGLINLLFELGNSVFGKWQYSVVGLCLAIAAFYPLGLIHSQHLKVYIAGATIMPAIIYFLACIQHRRPECGKSWVLIGDLTYASYLLHFPLQIVMHALFIRFGILNPLKLSTLCSFLLFTYVMSYLTYSRFELPAKELLRRRLK